MVFCNVSNRIAVYSAMAAIASIMIMPPTKPACPKAQGIVISEVPIMVFQMAMLEIIQFQLSLKYQCHFYPMSISNQFIW